jgi:hypothetical protein
MVKLFYFDVRMMAKIRDNWVVKARRRWNFFMAPGGKSSSLNRQRRVALSPRIVLK